MPAPAYQHRWLDGSALDWPCGKVVCVGRNYAEHAKELNNPVPAEPLLFIKPGSCVMPLAEPIRLRPEQGACHFETELTLLIGQPLTQATPQQATSAIAGIGLGLDLTLRDVQTRLKQQGHPWEIAKAFDGACRLGPFVPASELPLEVVSEFHLYRNQTLTQHGRIADMLTPIPSLVSHMSHHFTLQPGDVVMTGTPAGVSALQPSDQLELVLNEGYRFICEVAASS